MLKELLRSNNVPSVAAVDLEGHGRENPWIEAHASADRKQAILKVLVDAGVIEHGSMLWKIPFLSPDAQADWKPDNPIFMVTLDTTGGKIRFRWKHPEGEEFVLAPSAAWWHILSVVEPDGYPEPAYFQVYSAYSLEPGGETLDESLSKRGCGDRVPRRDT